MSILHKKFVLSGVFFVLALAPLEVSPLTGLAPVFVSAATLGETVTFNIDTAYDVKGRDKITSTLRVEGENAHYYVEDEYWQGLGANQQQFLANLEDLAKEFDTRIYPLEHQAFGSEPNPGIDNDSKITVLITPLIQDAGGYFLIGNEFPKSKNPTSNEREMVYLTADAAKAGRWREFLSHEFQHLITFGAKELRINKNEEVWLNELRSEYAVTLLGYDDRSGVTNVALRANSFLREPGDGLIEWQNRNADYGTVTMFGQYLVQTYGIKILRETIENNSVGIASLEDAIARRGSADDGARATEDVLRNRGLTRSFLETYVDWLKTNFLGGYQHQAIQNFRLVPGTMYNLSGSFSLSTQNTVRSWSINAIGVGLNEAGLEFELRSEPGESWLLVVIKKNAPQERPLVYQFTGTKTVDVALPAVTDQSIIVVPVNVTERVAPRDGASHTSTYALTVKTLHEVAVPTPVSGLSEMMGPVSTATPSPSATPAPTPAPTPVPSPSPQPTPVPQAPSVSFPDGTLIREKGDARVWIVNGVYLRHIAHPAIFGLYRHLRWEDVREVEPGTLGRYRVSRLIRAAGDEKVYEIDGAGVKHWLNMTPAAFVLSGRDWTGVYVVNSEERDFYRTGDFIR